MSASSNVENLLLLQRLKNLEELVKQAVPAVRGACKKAEKKAGYDQKHAPTYFLMHLDRAVLWRSWLNQAELLLPGLEATMPEDHLEEFHNRNDLTLINELLIRLRRIRVEHGNSTVEQIATEAIALIERKPT